MPFYLYQGLPKPDYADIRPDDTRLSWLQRTEHVYTWSGHPDTGEPVGLDEFGVSVYQGHIGLRISEGQFQLYKAGLQNRVPPIWPGVDQVTLGTTIPATGTTTITAPMDGILVLITTVWNPSGFWGDGSERNYWHFGKVAFISDNGDLEVAQFMGWNNQLLCPKTMKRAAGVVVYFEKTNQGAITPWLIT